MKTEEVLAVALNLSESERVYVATRLLESVPDSDEQISMDDPDFFEELDRRFLTVPVLQKPIERHALQTIFTQSPRAPSRSTSPPIKDALTG